MKPDRDKRHHADEPSEKPTAAGKKALGIGMAIGAAFGMILSILIKNMAIGMPLGIALGLIYGTAAQKRTDKKHQGERKTI